jgi:isopropylmalate/homocitrate/citramalate synthase
MLRSERATIICMQSVQVVEVAPRDGLQNERAILPTEAKLELVTALVATGVRRIEVTSFVSQDLADVAADAAPGIPLRWHFHNTRNTGYANAITAVERGAAALDASAGGIGGCPFAPAATGNIATEDLLYLLHRSGVQTGMSLPALEPATNLLAGALGTAVPGLLSRAGPFPG